MDNLLNDLSNAFNPWQSEEMELAAVWLEEGIILPCGRKGSRIATGMLVNVKGGNLVDSEQGQSTHKVIGCYGTINNKGLKFMIIDTLTNQPEIIELCE